MKTKETTTVAPTLRRTTMTRRIHTTFAVMIAAFLLSGMAFAEGACGYNTPIVPDGRVTQSTIPANTTFWYNLYPAIPGRSYSVEFRSVTDRPPSFAFTLLVTTNCSGNPYAGVRNTNTIAPGVGAGGERRSFTVSAESPVVMFSFTNTNNLAMTYTFSVSETTMFSPKWDFTSGVGMNSFYNLANTTDATITGTLKFLSITGSVVGTAPVTLPPGGFKDVARFEFGAGIGNPTPFTTGAVHFTHDGPPGAVVIDAYTLLKSLESSIYDKSGSFSGHTYIVVPIKVTFEARRERR